MSEPTKQYPVTFQGQIIGTTNETNDQHSIQRQSTSQRFYFKFFEPKVSLLCLF